MPTAVIPETDVIDLERYLKLPHWMSEAEKVKYTSRLTNSHTNSSTGTIRRYGEVIAVRVWGSHSTHIAAAVTAHPHNA